MVLSVHKEEKVQPNLRHKTEFCVIALGEMTILFYQKKYTVLAPL